MKNRAVLELVNTNPKQKIYQVFRDGELIYSGAITNKQRRLHQTKYPNDKIVDTGGYYIRNRSKVSDFRYAGQNNQK